MKNEKTTKDTATSRRNQPNIDVSIAYQKRTN